VADQVYVKYGLNNLGEEEVKDIIIIENKLKDSTPLTDNQKGAKLKSSYTVRSNNIKSVSQNSSKELTSGEILSFDRNIKWYKAWDSDNGDIITGIKKI
jgi:hypothetical protein